MRKLLAVATALVFFSSSGLIAAGKYKEVKLKPKNFKPIIVKYLTPKLADAQKTRVEAVILTAREWLPKVANILKERTMSDKVKKWANKYFKTDLKKGPDSGELTAIKHVIQNTLNGINAELPVKMHDTEDAYGFVVSYLSTDGNGQGRTQDGELIERKGDIHVSDDLFTEKTNLHLAVVTFIHEATHRFSNTYDFGDQGYINNDGGDFWKPGIEKDDALRNADSYAWFIYKVISGE